MIGYNMRNYVELAVQRYKRMFGNTLKTRFASAKTAIWISECACTQHHAKLGMMASVRVWKLPCIALMAYLD
jgi:hypothetical protein